MKEDSYLTIAVERGVGRLTIQRSRFLSFAFPIGSAEEAEAVVNTLRGKEYHDATHVCYAYAIGIDRRISRIDDDGEPGGTAGRPIYGQILSANLSDVLLVVVRYFGGVKLGTGGLIKAYGECAALALEGVERKEIVLTDKLKILFKPDLTGIVMNLLNRAGASIEAQDFIEGRSALQASVRRNKSDDLLTELNEIFGVEGKKVLPL